MSFTIQSWKKFLKKQKTCFADYCSEIQFLESHQNKLFSTHGASFSKKVVECIEIQLNLNLEVKELMVFSEK